jgi:twinkle protein
MDGEKTYDFHAHRAISTKTYEFYGVYTEFIDGTPSRVGFVYPNKAIKFRTYDKKDFYSEGPMNESGCFGTDKFDKGSKAAIVIVEGEYDALAAYEALHGDYAVISVRGASSAKRDCTRDYEYINSFSKIILCFDNDEPGQSAARSVSPLFDFSKVYHVQLNRHKDANEYLVASEANEFLAAVKAAKRYAPDNIISTYEEFSRTLVETKDDVLATTPFPTLTSRLHGLLSGRVYVFKGMEGIGKTEIFRAMEHHVLSTTKHNIGVLHLEEDNGTTIKALAGYVLKCPTTAPDSSVSQSEIMAAIRNLTHNSEERLHIHESWDVEDENAILDNIRFLVSAANCRIIFLDHISWLATGLDEDEDERRKLDRISQKLKLLAKELKFALCLISHVNDNGQTRGSRNITKNADVVVHMSRDIRNVDPVEASTLHLFVEKARGAHTGHGGNLIFDTEECVLREKSAKDEIKVPMLN